MTARLGKPQLEDEEEQADEITALQAEVQRRLRLGYDIIQIDECLFNAKHVSGKTWAPTSQAFVKDHRFASVPYIAVCGAISM